MRHRLALIACALSAACASEPPTVVAAPTERASASPATSAAPIAATPPKVKHGVPLVWETNDEVATDLARRQHRPRIVVLCAEWAAACKEQRRAFSGPEFEGVARRFVLAWIDLTDDDADGAMKARQKYGPTVIPLVLVFDADGNERLRKKGYNSNDPILDSLRDIY
jgi:thiol:disulfide interchange protein